MQRSSLRKIQEKKVLYRQNGEHQVHETGVNLTGSNNEMKQNELKPIWLECSSKVLEGKAGSRHV